MALASVRGLVINGVLASVRGILINGVPKILTNKASAQQIRCTDIVTIRMV